MDQPACWHGIWNRPGLSRRDRSLLNLAMLTVLNRPHELKLHLKGALNNGVTRDEIREVLLQAAIYGGMLAGVDGFRVAREVFKSVDGRDAVAILVSGVTTNRPSVQVRPSTQFSRSRPGTRSNSPTLLVTRVRPALRACAAMWRSLTPMGRPVFSRAERMAP